MIQATTLRARTLAVLSAVALTGACSAPPTPTPPTVTAATATVTPLPSPTPSPTESPTQSPTAEPAPTATPIAPTADGVVNVPILYMHRVIDLPSDIGSWPSQQQRDFLPYVITPCEFSAELDYLVAQGYTTVLPRDLSDYWFQRRPLPGRPVILTFDDGSPDWAATVLPLLVAHGSKAEFYVTVDRIGTELSWDDVASLVAAGMGIGAHDMDHFQLAGGGVTTASLDVMRYQVGRAREVLASRLGVSVDSMAYVGGGFDSSLLGVVRDAGYSTARAILRGVTQSPGERFLLHVSRVGVFDDIVGKDIAGVNACDIVPGLPDYQARLSGADPN